MPRIALPVALSMAALTSACSTGTRVDSPNDASTTPLPEADISETAPDILTCASPLLSACHDKNHGSQIPCPPTWSATRCAAPADMLCAGFLGMADGWQGTCAYDATTRALVAYATLHLDTPPSCDLGPGISIPESCIETWLRSVTDCDLQHEPLHPWYCESLPGQTDQGAPCTSDAECNGGGVCIFNDLPVACESAVGRCSTLASFEAGCGSSTPVCACDGTTVTLCNNLATKAIRHDGPCAVAVDAGGAD